MNDLIKQIRQQAQQAQADIDAIRATLESRSEPDPATAKLRRHDDAIGGKSPDGISGGGRVQGIVKFFSRARGYGFINPDEGGQEVFVHYSAIDGEGYRNLYEGDRVEYTLVQTPRGPAAHNVEVKR